MGHHARVRLSRADRSAYLLAGLLTSTGVLHFVVPGPFRSIIPKKLPAKNALVAGSGVVELVCAGLVAAPRTRQIGGVLTVRALRVARTAGSQPAG